MVRQISLFVSVSYNYMYCTLNYVICISTVTLSDDALLGYINVRTTALAEDSLVARMAKLVEEAQNSRSKTQKIIDKCAKVYTPG